jgi:hypothetical protein
MMILGPEQASTKPKSCNRKTVPVTVATFFIAFSAGSVPAGIVKKESLNHIVGTVPGTGRLLLKHIHSTNFQVIMAIDIKSQTGVPEEHMVCSGLLPLEGKRFSTKSFFPCSAPAFFFTGYCTEYRKVTP